VHHVHAEMVKGLICEFGADLNAKDEGGLTPLQLAEQRGHVVDEFVVERNDITNANSTVAAKRGSYQIQGSLEKMLHWMDLGVEMVTLYTGSQIITISLVLFSLSSSFFMRE